MDQFLVDAEEFLYELQTGVFDRKIAKIVARSETKLLDRFIAAGRNTLSVLTRVRQHGQSVLLTCSSPCDHPPLREPTRFLGAVP